MKKFLSILLALAVGFTFTFGSAMSAFAGVADHAVAAKSAVTATAKALDATNVLADHASSGLTIHKAAWVKAYQNNYATELNNIINARYAEIQKIPGDGNTTEASVIAMFYEAKSGTNNFTTDPVPANVVEVVDVVYDKLADEAAGYEFESVKEDALAILAKVDLSEFSKTTPVSKDGSKVYTYFERAEKVVNGAIANVTATGFNGADPTVGTAKTEIGKIGDVAVSKYTKVTDSTPTETAGSGYLANICEKFNANGTTTGTYVLSAAGRTDSTGKIMNATEEAKESASLDAKKDSLKSFVASKGSSYVTKVSTAADATTAKIEAAKVAKDNYVKAYSYIIDAAKTEADLKTDLGAGGTSISELETAIKELDSDMAGTLAANEALVAELNTYAAKCLAETDVTGAKVRDEKLVNNSVQKSTVAAYKASIAKTSWTDGLATAKTDIEKNCNATTADIEYARQVALTTVENARKASLKAYYEKEQADVNAAYDKLVAEIKAANTSTDLAAAGTTATLTGIKTAAQVFSSLSSFVTITKYTNYQGILNANVKSGYERDFANTKIAKTEDDSLVAMTSADYWKEFFAAKGARTQAEVDAMWSDAVAAMEAVPTANALTAAKEKAETAINALPAALKITTADKDAIKAAFDAAQEYAAMTGVADYKASAILNKAQLTTAITTLAILEKNEIAIAANKLPATVAIADKAAVKEVAEAQKAFNEKVDEDSTDMYKIAGVAAISSTVATKMADIRALEAKAVKAAIDAIPFNITLNSKATIEAARAAYDAFVKEYTTYEADDMYGDEAAYNAAAQIANYEDLENAEKELGQLEKDSKWTADDAKAYVFDQTVKATSAKLSAKKVKVTANFDASKLVENGYTVEYKFYKSTKKSSGYKYTGVTKVEDAKTYTNTNAKKGANYYKFKVVVKDADGTVILTTALKDCKYACRTIK